MPIQRGQWPETIVRVALVLAMLSPTRTFAQGPETLKALQAYELTLPTLTKVLEAGRTIEKSPDATEVGKATSEMTRMSIEQVMTVVDRYPSTKRAVAASGLSNREYATALLSLVWASRYLAEEEMMKGLGRTPPAPPAHVPRPNVELVRRNRALIEKYQ